MTDQLNMLGLPVSEAPAARRAPLSRAQHDVLVLARRDEGVRGVEAGVALHARRNDGRGCRPTVTAADGHVYRPLPASNAADRWSGTRSEACCPWASTDGLELCKRLRDRGLVEQREPRGPWHATGTSA